MTLKKAEKELQRQAIMFEEAVNAGAAQDSRIRFEDFSRQWMEDYCKKQLKIKTYAEYEKRLDRINGAIGHIKLKDLRTGHLNLFYSNLQEDGMNRHTGGTLSSNSIRSYSRIISSCLGKAVKWGYLPYNPAINAELPKLDHKEAPHLDEADARHLLALLQTEPIKWRAIITFDLLSGLRRGELLDLRWQDIDFEAQTISVVQTASYAQGYGLYTDTPKNRTSARPLKLSRSAFLLLLEYKQWQDAQQAKLGDAWKDSDSRVFTADDGAPMFPDSISQWFAKFVKRTGMPKVTVHSLRHTYASLMIADGTPLVVVSHQLGHAQTSTTANIYTHVIASAEAKAAQTFDKFNDLIVSDLSEKDANKTG